MTPWTEAYAKFFSMHVYASREVLTTDEVDEIVIDIMQLIDRIHRHEQRSLVALYRVLLPAFPFLIARASEDTAERLRRISDILLDTINLVSVKR